MLIGQEELDEFNKAADEYIDSGDLISLHELVNRFSEHDYSFAHPFFEASYLYSLGNCYSALYRRENVEWYSDDLMKSVISYRKALYALPDIKFGDAKGLIDAINELKSMIETNLANCLSSQGRVLCCIPHYNKAIMLDNNPVAIISKARNELFVADSIFDFSHSEYHYFTAYELIQKGISNIDRLYPEQRYPLEPGGTLFNHKEIFEANYNINDFDYFKEFEERFKSKKQKEYLEWCAENTLFLNDLNDCCDYQIVYQDVFSLPPFIHGINGALTMHEELSYHGNYDEIKDDYCYARFLIFSSKDISDEACHMFNSTFQHVDDMSHSINNMKVAQYKSAFRAIYSLFDKIAYLLSRFFDLNDIKHDRRLSIDNLFRNFNYKGDDWRPHDKLKDSDNHFMHALFYILKDLRKVGKSDVVSKWFDPNAVAFSEIRNAMEHRSLKIVDDFGYELAMNYNGNADAEFNALKEKVIILKSEINQREVIFKTIKNNNDKADGQNIDDELVKLNHELDILNKKIYEKQKLSSHSLLIPISKFESRLMQLIGLARNSIMYLSLAIHFEERRRPEEGFYMPREVPLKKL